METFYFDLSLTKAHPLAIARASYPQGSTITAMKWPRSKTTQTIIALALGAVAAIAEWLQLAMESFNNFYFGPHKAFPYPYPDAHSANIAMTWKCGFAFALVFIATLALQRLILKRKSL